MNCDNPECYNLIQPGGGVRVLARFVWDEDAGKSVVVCCHDCITPALKATA